MEFIEHFTNIRAGSVIGIVILYLLLINILGFALMAVDKWKATHHRWRIPEAHLLLVAAVGGSLGAFLAMHVCRHKTRKWYFRYVLPVLLALHVIVGAYIIGSEQITIM